MVKAEVDNPALAETVGKAFDSIEKLKPGIYQAGDQGKAMADVGLIDPIISPTSKEVFNRSVMLHEAREVGKHPGVFRFASHNSLTPMLQDLNIAATLKGPGVDDAVLAIRQMRRPEVEGLKMTVPDVGRLNLGEQRLSRHAQKRLQEAYDRALFSGAERRGQTPVQSMIFPRTDATKLYRKKMSKS